MLLPDEDGMYRCEHQEFSTENIFEYMHHAGMDFDWMVKLNRKYSFNMFTFLEQLAWNMSEKNYKQVWHSVQGVALLFVNSSGDDFEEFMKETEVVSSADDMFEQIEDFLKEVGRDDS